MHDFVTKMTAAWPPDRWLDLSVVLAVSGGPDSVALLRVALAIRESQSQQARSAGSSTSPGPLIVGHFNHGIRQEDSQRDQQFVEALCHDLNVPCQVGHADVQQLARQMGDGLEAAARTARYRFLQDLAEQTGARYLVTGHTADDQAETILHRIVRGTGLRGLSGMPRSRPLSPAVSLLRPMLETRRAEVLAYLEDVGQPFRSDTSNQDTSHTRNRIRHDLLPFLEREFNPTASDALLRLGRLADEVQTTMDQITGQYTDRCITRSAEGNIRIDCSSLASASAYIVRELMIGQWQQQGWPLQSMGFEQWETLASLALGDSDGTITLPGNVRAQKKDGQLTLSRPG